MKNENLPCSRFQILNGDITWVIHKEVEETLRVKLTNPEANLLKINKMLVLKYLTRKLVENLWNQALHLRNYSRQTSGLADMCLWINYVMISSSDAGHNVKKRDFKLVAEL